MDTGECAVSGSGYSMDLFQGVAQMRRHKKPPASIRTLVDVARWQADIRGGEIAYTLWTDDEGERSELSFLEVDARARAIAAVLLEHGTPGDRVLIVQEPGLEYVTSLLGSMYAGMIAVPVYPPDLFRLRQTLPRLQAITSQCEARIMLSSRQILGDQVGPLWHLCRDAALATEDIDSHWSAQWQDPGISAEALGLLQYTSGSTGIPRGVALRHRNLLANTEQGFEAFDVPQAVAVFWLPPYHDFGLIGGLLTPLYGGRQSVLMSPIAFAQEPIRWFRAITRYRGTTTASPNFGYEWCLRKIRLEDCENIDLSSLRITAMGAEPIRAATINRFTERFAPLGLNPASMTPGYGLAEATLVVTNKPQGTSPIVRTFDRDFLTARHPHAALLTTNAERRAVALVSAGRPVIGCHVRIVDPETKTPLADGDIGEIWVQSPSVAEGYWNRPEVSRETFGIHCNAKEIASGVPSGDRGLVIPRALPATPAPVAGGGEEGFLRTGDLGFLLDGELFVSGRLKEQIIIAGRNYFPHDIEAAIQGAHEAFRVDGGIVFSIDGERGEQLVVVHEILRPKLFAFADLTRCLLETILEHFGLVPAAIRFVKASTLPKTSSGKLQRLEGRRQFLEGELQVLHAWDAPESEHTDGNSSATSPGESTTALCSTGALLSTTAPIEQSAVPESSSAINSNTSLSPFQSQAARLWCDVLDVPQATRDQHFLHLGGHSLAATQLLVRLRETFSVSMDLSDLFLFPTFGELVDEVQRRMSAAAEGPPPSDTDVAPLDPHAALPLTATQQGFWLLDQMERYDAFLHVGVTLEIRGKVDPVRLTEACRTLPFRHPALAAAIIDAGTGVPVQQWKTPVPLPVSVVDLSSQPKARQEDTFQQQQRELMRAPFTLAQPPLARIAIFVFGSDHLRLSIVAHHLICDGWSIGLLADDLSRAYAGESEIQSPLLWSSVVTRHSQRDGGDASAGLANQTENDRIDYWKQRLVGVAQDQSLQLPPPAPRGAEVFSDSSSATPPREPSKSVTSVLDSQATSTLQRSAAALGVTPFSVLVTLWHAVLDRYRSGGDLVFGIPIANRLCTEDERVVASLIETIPFRPSALDLSNVEAVRRASGTESSHPGGDEDAALDQHLDQSICRTHQQWIEDFQHRGLPLERIVDALGIERPGDGMPLVNHLFLHQVALRGSSRIGEGSIEDYHTDYSSLAAYETALAVETHGPQTSLILVYDPQRIAGEIADNLLASLKHLLSEFLDRNTLVESRLAEGPSVPGLMSRSMGAAEAARIAGRSMGRLLDDEPRSFLEQFRSARLRNPQAPAVIDQDEKVSYAALDDLSTQIAVSLRARGIERDAIVAVDIQRRTALSALLIGIWKAGAAYLPLDPSHPAGRIREVLEDAHPQCLIHENPIRHQSTAIPEDLRCISLAEILQESAERVRQNQLPSLQCDPHPTDLAYLIYTSGSTGKPKGVAIEHRSVSNLVRSFARQPGLGRRESILASTTISFDISVLELFLPLAVGGTCFLAPRSISEDPESVIEFLGNHDVDVLQGTPSSIRMLMTLGWKARAGQRIWCGGEPLHADLARQLLEMEAELWNVYGPTETTVWSMLHRVSLDQLPGISLGHPIDHTTIRVLDARKRPVPVGVQGELWIGGAGVARGYWKKPELTADRFRSLGTHGLKNQGSQGLSSCGKESRFYRTGDIVRWLPGGGLQFLGRADRQIKIRGQRIELGEIEAILNALPGIGESAVTAAPGPDGQPRLIAFYSGTGTERVEPADVQRALAERLPSAMIPGSLIALASIPHSVAGKIDYRALPLDPCVLGATSGNADRPPYAAPRDSIEQHIADAWSEVLRVTAVGIHDNFFDLGGHSLTAAQVFARLRQHFGTPIPLRELYRRPTIAQLAQWYRDSAAQQPAADTAVEEQPPTGIQYHERPLSFAEQRLWFVDQLEPNHPFYNLPLAAEVRGPLDLELLTRCINRCVARHETLRSTYHLSDGNPRRSVVSELRLRPAFVDLTKVRATAGGDMSGDEQLQMYMQNEARRPFALHRGPLLRVTIYRRGENHHVVLLVMHHIVSDGWSMAVMLAELAEFYRAAKLGEEPRLPALETNYSDFALRQRWQHDEAASEQSLRYWQQTLADSTETLDLPTDFERPAVQGFDGAMLPFEFDPQLSAAIARFARQHQCTPFMVLLTAYAVLLARYSRQSDLNIGTAIANRPTPELERLIGFFVGTLVLRAKIEGMPSFAAFLEQMKGVTIEAFSHAEMPFEQLVQRLASSRQRSHSPLFQAAFVFQNTPRDFISAPELTLTPRSVDNGTAKYDLTLFLWEKADRLAGHFEYRTSLFREASIARMQQSLVALLESAIAEPETPIDRLRILSPSSEQGILARCQGPQVQFEGPRVLHELFEYRAQHCPDRTAVIFRRKSWTYQELARCVHAFARGLQQLTIGKSNRPIILYMQRSVSQLTAQFAVNRCGRAFVPVDTNFPLERLESIAIDLGAETILIDEELCALARERFPDSIQIFTADQVLAADVGSWNPVVVREDDPAYLIFTSGSTGKPKGVIIEHHSICNFVHCFCERVEMTPEDRSTYLLSPSFDGALSESMTTLTRGASLAILESSDAFDPERITQFLNEHRVTFAPLTPAILSSLHPDKLPFLTRVLSGGAAATAELAAPWVESRRLFNGYGPTECTVGSAIHEITELFQRTAPIGTPLPNMRMYILDQHLQLVPDGVPGEVFIGGQCLARGYWNQPQLTSERFIADPWLAENASSPPTRMYRTGDLGRWNSRGLIEIIGRCDDQIKLRGYRIEPGEISAVMESLPEVQASTVVAWSSGDEGGDQKRLVAYFVPAEEPQASGPQSHLPQSHLPQSNAQQQLDSGLKSESSFEVEHIRNWRELFDQSSSRSSVALRPEENFAGWQSVITGKGIESSAMAEWADRAARRIADLHPQRILEIGCGTGLILWRLGNAFARYYGIDLLESSIAQLRETLRDRPEIAGKVDVDVRLAHTIDDLPEGSFDTIVLNSIVQYFPSGDYFLGVLRRAVRLLSPGGRIFLGDLRDLRLQAAFAVEVEQHRAAGESLDSRKFQRRVVSRMENDEELLVDPRMFQHLHQQLDRLTAVQVLAKQGTYGSELNRYRFDCVLQFDGGEMPAIGDAIRYPDSPWLDRQGELRIAQVIWACLAAGGSAEPIESLFQRAEDWVASIRDIDGIAQAARIAGYPWTELPANFAANQPRTWTSRPLRRRVHLELIHRIREGLRQRLPEYMIPTSFVPLDALPKTIQGKIDRAALPLPPASRPQWAGICTPPRDQEERVLAEVWEELLEISPIGIEDNFFDLGGHSMLAVRMVAEVEKRTQIQLPLAALFREPTIANLAEFLRNPQQSGPAAAIIPLAQSPQGRPLFCIHPAGGTVFCYREFSELFDGVRPVYGLQARGVDGRETPHQNLTEMAAYYAEAIRLIVPSGQCDLVGWSMGGNIAYEVARQLLEADAWDGNLFLLDAGLLGGAGLPGGAGTPGGEAEFKEEDLIPLLAALFPGQQQVSLDELRSRSPEDQARYLVGQLSQAGIVPVDADLTGMQIFGVFQSNIKAVHNYRPLPLDADIHLIRPQDQAKTGALFDDPQLGWKPWVRSVHVHYVPGDHAGMLGGQAAKKVAQLVASITETASQLQNVP